MNSIPPAYSGGNIDDWRIGESATTEDETISVGVNFGVAQGVDANWGVHSINKKAMFGVQGRSQGGMVHA